MKDGKIKKVPSIKCEECGSDKVYITPCGMECESCGLGRELEEVVEFSETIELMLSQKFFKYV